MNNLFLGHVYIENNIEYRPTKENKQFIVGLHLTRPLNSGIWLHNLSGDSIYFPKTGFIAGGIYNYPIIKIVYEDPESDNNAFLGCYYNKINK